MTPVRRPSGEPRRALGRALCTTMLAVLLSVPITDACDAAPVDPRQLDDLAYLQRLEVLAESGDAGAAFLLGVTLASGRAGVRDDSAALRWFRLAASTGMPVAQYNLALMLSQGRGGERDFVEALRWYEAASELGMAEASFNAGMMLLDGAPGVPADTERGVALLRRAAERGLARAEFNLGVLREFGRGLPRDLNAAAAWYQRASRQGYEPARERLARLHGGAQPASPALAATPVQRTAAGAGPSALAALPAPAATDETATVAPPVSASPAAIADLEVNAWVLARDPARYTLQLFSRRDEEGVREFVARHGLGDDGGYFRTLADGQTWFSVVYGDFESRAAAEYAGKRLPRKFGAVKPWVRNFGAIHKAVER